jgi:hypothetical protein
MSNINGDKAREHRHKRKALRLRESMRPLKAAAQVVRKRIAAEKAAKEKASK